MTAGIEDKIIFAVMPAADGCSPMSVMVAIPKQAWEHMKDGKISHFTLEAIGIPIHLVLFGADDHHHAVELLKKARHAGTALIDDLLTDFAIKPKGIH